MEHARQPRRVRRRLTIVNEDAAGLDVGATFHVVAIPADRDAEPVRTFQSFTADLHALADWLQSVGIRTIAMESTGSTVHDVAGHHHGRAHGQLSRGASLRLAPVAGALRLSPPPNRSV